LILVACATPSPKHIHIAQPSLSEVQQNEFATAGARSIDITPPPGLPMGGYSVMANYGQGFRTRLKARVIYLNDGRGHATALVQTDLTSASLLLHHQVASRVAAETQLRPGDIVITGSHSHSAPANIFANDFYNKHMSNDKWLAESYLSFLTERIAKGIIQAYGNRRQAKISTGKTDIYGYNRNRSIDAYVLNENVQAVNKRDKDAVFKAVNPALYMIRIDVKDEQGIYSPLAAFSSFSVHATAISPKTEVYSADLFAYAQRELEWEIETKYQTRWPVVHAMSTGTQGDIAPALPLDGDNYISHFDLDWKAAKKIGQDIGKESIKLFEALGNEMKSDFHLSTVAREIDIRQNNKIGDIELCKEPAIGSPVVAGAFERRTPWLSVIPFFKGGNIFSRRWFFTDGCQGNKSHIAFSFFQPVLEPKESFPSVVMFQQIKIDDMLILPMPFEVTTEAGRRISQSVNSIYARNNSEQLKYVWIASNANGYLGYTTTPEEYARQNYEGGHTLYGRYTTPYLTEQQMRLALDHIRKGTTEELLPKWDYDVNTNQFYPKPEVSFGKRRSFMAPDFQQTSGENQEDYISFKWIDVGPSEIKLHQPLMRVENKIDNKWQPLFIDSRPVSDEGYDLEIRFIKTVDKNMALYEGRWYNPRPGSFYRFTVAPRKDHARISSKAFKYYISDDLSHIVEHL